jgi:tetratricopeptide (TPR) repeat protein
MNTDQAFVWIGAPSCFGPLSQTARSVLWRAAAVVSLAAFLCGGAAAAQASQDRRSPGFASYQRANGLFVAKKFPESAAALDEALRLDPKLVPALTLKAKIALAANDFDGARQTLEAALAVDPASSYAQLLYGLQFYLRDDMEHALPEFEKARKLNPSDARAAVYLGRTTEALGQADRALLLYQETVRLEEAAGGAQADTLLAGARLLLLAGRLDECEQWTRRAVKLDRKSRDGHYELARLLLRKGDAAGAAAEGELALGLANGDTPDRQIHYLLVLAYRESSPADAARHAKAMEPN